MDAYIPDVVDLDSTSSIVFLLAFSSVFSILTIFAVFAEFGKAHEQH